MLMLVKLGKDSPVLNNFFFLFSQFLLELQEILVQCLIVLHFRFLGRLTFRFRLSLLVFLDYSFERFNLPLEDLFFL